MKIAFEHIRELLDDSFFELRVLGKNAVRSRIRPVGEYGGAPDNLQFVDWVAEDDTETVRYSFHDTAIGRLLLADTAKGLCFAGFATGDDACVKADFAGRFQGQPIKEEAGVFQTSAAGYCNGDHSLTIPLHLKGTGFQVGIWKQLVRIPSGRLSTYGSLSDNAGAARAVGSAVGANPVSYIVPCHRIVRSDGSFRGYHWGTDIKKQLLAYEFQH